MEQYIKNIGDITYLPELTLDILKRLLGSKMSRVKFALITYSHLRVRKLCVHLKWKR